MTWVPWGADHPIRRAKRVVRDEEGRCGSRGASVNPATSSASATGIVSIRCECNRRGGSEDPHPTRTWVPWGADPLIRRANRVVRDEEGRCGSRGAWVNPATSSASATGTVSIRCERDRRGGSEDPHPTTTWVPWGADHPIRRANRVVRDEEGRCGSRGAWVNPATSSASATGTVSIRCERDRRGGSEDPHPYR